MRNIFKIQFVLLAMLALACSSDDDSGPSYSFKDQDLTGEIEGTTWVYDDGYVEELTLEGEDVLSFRLFAAEEDAPCDILFSDNGETSFELPNAVGLYKLNNTRVVRFVIDDDGIPSNSFTARGAVEITSITETTVTGKIDARLDGDTHVNGNFTVSFCQDPT